MLCIALHLSSLVASKVAVDALEGWWYAFLLKVSYLTKVGQCLDTITAPEDDVDLDRFSLERFVHEYNKIWVHVCRTFFRMYHLYCRLVM